MNKLIKIILYLFPILLVTILTQSITYFTMSVGIMTILLGLSMKFIPDIIGYKNQNIKTDYHIFIIVTGIFMLMLASDMLR